MEKQYARVEFERFHTCTVGGESTRVLNYRSDSPGPVCDDCLARMGGYTRAERFLAIESGVADIVKANLEEDRYSAYFIYGKTGGTAAHRVWTCDRCLAWGHDHIGRPRFNARDSLQDILSMRGKECIGVLVTLPSLQIPPSAGNLTCLSLTTSPLVCMVDCNEPHKATAVLRAEGETREVVVAMGV